MAGKKHKPEQIIAKLREADALLAGGASVGQVCQRLEVSEPTLARWRSQYGGMKSSDASANCGQLCGTGVSRRAAPKDFDSLSRGA